MFNGTLNRAILETLAYSDVFDYPLHLDELYRYLPICAEIEQLPQMLGLLNDQIGMKDSYYFLTGREEIVEIRKQREAHSQKLMQHALKYGRMLGCLPFIRMVALTASLAVMNSSENSDFDYMLVAAPKRVWTARAFALLFNRFTRLFGYTLCPNLIVSENALAWSTHDLYSARELYQMIPIKGMDIYQRLLKTNEWAKDFLPNALLECGSLLPHTRRLAVALQSLFELPLRGKLGDRIEQWEMNRKITRFSKQSGFGEETVFNADICQGNFDHHRKWTRDMFEKRLMNIDSPLPSGEGLGVRVQ